MRKMSLFTIFSPTFKDLSALIQTGTQVTAGAYQPSVGNDAATLAALTSGIAVDSILKAGEDRSRAIADILDMLDFVDYVPNPNAASGDLHAMLTSKRVRLVVPSGGTIRVLLMDKQELFAKNNSKDSLKVIISHFHPTTGEQVHVQPQTLVAGEICRIR